MHLRRAQSGQAMVEFAIIGAVLLILILGTLQFALIYHAKITLNYAAFETARAGAVNNARMWAMELAFSRAMAPLYVTPYTIDNGGTCTSNFAFSDTRSNAQMNTDRDTTRDFDLDNIKCARQRVRDMITNQLVRLTLVNPSVESFTDHGISAERIPSDNLMYRSALPGGISMQSIQDANLIKVHIGFCYELIVPLVDRIIWRMIRFGPSNLEPDNFGPPRAGSFAEACTSVLEPDGSPQYRMPVFAEATMRMQSDAIRDTFCAGQCGP